MIRVGNAGIEYTDRSSGIAVSKTAEVPSFYAACAVAGYRASLPASQPMTNAVIPGLKYVTHSSNYFSPDQMDTIAEGGNFILLQRTPNAPVTVRHQLSTDMSAIETREMSIRIAVDYAAKKYRTSLRPYLGKHNITDQYLSVLRATMEGITKALIDEGVLRRGTQLVSLTQNTTYPDEVDSEVSMKIYYPCNRINVKLTY
jgi:hypothetical protein